MEHLNPYSNLGDTLSAIKFNFNCLDVHTCNLNYAAQDYNKMELSNNWGDVVTETFFMSGNWDSYSTHVHNASSYWDNRVHTIIYPFPFPEGTLSTSVIRTWLTSTFPPQNYRPDEFFIVSFFGYYKDPSLHRPSTQSLTKFGALTETNNVHIKDIQSIIFIQKNDTWVLAQDFDPRSLNTYANGAGIGDIKTRNFHHRSNAIDIGKFEFTPGVPGDYEVAIGFSGVVDGVTISHTFTLKASLSVDGSITSSTVISQTGATTTSRRTINWGLEASVSPLGVGKFSVEYKLRSTGSPEAIIAGQNWSGGEGGVPGGITGQLLSPRDITPTPSPPHINQVCLSSYCGCYGPKYILENPVCIPQSTYYLLSCTYTPIVTSAPPDPCLSGNYTVEWEFEIDNYALSNDITFKYISAGDLPPYQITPSKNPSLDILAPDVWTHYIRDTAKPIRINSEVDRHPAKDLLYRYRFDTSCSCFVPSGIYLKELGLWTLSAEVTASFGFKNTELITFLNKSGKSDIVDGNCPFDIYIDTEWSRWVTNNVFSITAAPYWHIGIAPGSAALGFDYYPIPSVSDPASAWAEALNVLGYNDLSAYFGTELDLMGHVLSVVVLPITETYPLSTG